MRQNVSNPKSAAAARWLQNLARPVAAALHLSAGRSPAPPGLGVESCPRTHAGDTDGMARQRGFGAAVLHARHFSPPCKKLRCAWIGGWNQPRPGAAHAGFARGQVIPVCCHDVFPPPSLASVQPHPAPPDLAEPIPEIEVERSPTPRGPDAADAQASEVENVVPAAMKRRNVFEERRHTARQITREADFHHHVYVVLLRPAVARRRKVRRENPARLPTQPCVYVGMTGLTPEERFANHQCGKQSAWVVKKFGVRLLPELYAHLNPMPYGAALIMEQELAEDLRRLGYTVTGGH